MRYWGNCTLCGALLLLRRKATVHEQTDRFPHREMKSCSPHDKAVEAEDGKEAGDEVDQPDWGLQAELDDVDVIPGGPLLRQGGCIGKLL